MGEAGIALPGPGRARLPERMEKAACQAPAPVRLIAIQPRLRGRGIETPEQAAERGKFDLALVAALSDAGLRRSEAAALTWRDVRRWDDGAAASPWFAPRPTPRPRAQWWPSLPATMGALSAIRPAGVDGEAKVFGMSESQIARRVMMIAKAAGLADWAFFSGHSGRVGMARHMAQNGDGRQ